MNSNLVRFCCLTIFQNEINEKYRYVLGPLILQCFENKFGREKTINVLKLLLAFAENETLTIEHWKNAAIKSGISKTDFGKFEKEFISNKNFKKNVIKEIKKIE